MIQHGWLTRRYLFRVGVIMLLLLFLAPLFTACSKPAEQSKANTGTISNGTANQTSKAIKIGAVYPLTGPWAEGGQNSLNGMKLAVDLINEQGGIKSMGGAKLEIVTGDTANDPAQAASVTRRLIENDKVVALVGAYVSSFTLTASTEAEKAGVPMISQSYLDQLTARGYKYFFQLPPKASIFGAETVSYFKQMLQESKANISKAVVVSSNDAATAKQADTVSQLLKNAGFQVLFTELFAPGLSDASSIATKIRDSGAQVVFTGGPTPDVILVTRTLRSLGLKIPVVGVGGGGILNKGFGQALKGASDGVFGMAAWNWDLPYPGVKEMQADYVKKFNEPFMPQEAGESYIATWILKEALENVGAADPAKIRDYLANTTFQQGPAAAMTGGKVKFDSTGYNSGVFPVMIEWRDQKPYTVWPKEVRSISAFFK